MTGETTRRVRRCAIARAAPCGPLDVADVVMARREGVQTRVGQGLQGGQTIDVLIADLSPDGQHLISEGESTKDTALQPTIFDVTTGKRIPVVTGVYWTDTYRCIDDNTFAVRGFDKNGDGQRLLLCEVGDECSVQLLPAP